MTENPHRILDITDDLCPMTFVKTKLLIERMGAGETGEIHLKGQEPIENVPRAIAGLGHEIISMTRVADEPPEGVHVLLVRKKSIP